MSEKYLGKIVFVEAKYPEKAYPSSGEFVIIRQTPNNLYGMKLMGGYESHRTETFPLTGERAYNVVSVDEDDKLLLELADEIEHFAGTPDRGEHTHWIGSVYNGAGSNARLLRKAIKEKNAGKALVQCTERVAPQKSGLVETLSKIVELARSATEKQEEPHTKGLTFGEALEAMKQGKRVKRAHWGGYWFIVPKPIISYFKPGCDFPCKQEASSLIVAHLKDDGGDAVAHPYHEDLLAHDWEIVD